eukprot:TRINITY_DN22046_c0_g1_i1.p1 TRINITY_DN22046_c0_g1~~TRINITY_DN22046_c0_g1_i1.p1  ORF type:complete len:323 (+),score=36.93 TRINITY_DN22046_c0_g1_i1:155-1123(+)
MPHFFGRTGTPMASASIGSLCALLQLLGPDHLCTIMSLSSTQSEWEAVKIGGAWGFAHCAGTVMVCMLFQVLRLKVAIDLEIWEHYGDYFVGVSLMLCALYFIQRESDYIVQSTDGTMAVRACDCHRPALDPEGAGDIPKSSVPRTRRKKKTELSLASSYKNSCTDEDCKDIECNPLIRHSARAMETAPLLEPSRNTVAQQLSLFGSSCLGLLQGVCCPMALVNLNFVAFVPTPLTMIVFAVCYVMVSVFGAGFISWFCSRFIVGGFGKVTSPRLVYRGSCALTLVFGVSWVAATAFRIDIFDVKLHVELPQAIEQVAKHTF